MVMRLQKNLEMRLIAREPDMARKGQSIWTKEKTTLQIMKWTAKGHQSATTEIKIMTIFKQKTDSLHKNDPIAVNK
jgi:hypothetical protein